MVRAVVEGGRDIVCAPYPRREKILLGNVAAPDPYGRPPEARAYEYNLTLLPTSTRANGSELAVEQDGCVEVETMPIGCSVIARRVFEQLISTHRELTWTQGHGAPCVAIFEMVWRDGRLCSEDISFLHRARASGFKVHMYLGPGTPATHHGMHAFRGDVGAFGVKRVER
jgi:hypothetical protein